MEPAIRRTISFVVAMILSLTLFVSTTSAFAAETTETPMVNASEIEAVITPIKTNTTLNATRFLSLVGGIAGFAIIGGLVISGVRQFEDNLPQN